MSWNKISSDELNDISRLLFRRNFSELPQKDKYRALSTSIMKRVIPIWDETEDKLKDKKKAYYLSAEFLMGRALGNNLINLKAEDEVKEELKNLGIDLNKIEEAEADAGLGNGGLGRLAACFLDSAATLGYPLDGYGIRYEYGIFRQQIINGMQVEEGDDWNSFNDPWSIRRDDEKKLVKFADTAVYAVPYDTPVIGYGGKTINTLRLYTAEPLNKFNFDDFNSGRYAESVEELNEAMNISRVLYPNDSTREGKVLRLKQQYFFTSASLQDILDKYIASGKDIEDFHKYHAVQLNDTHPSVAVAELIRLLTEKSGLEFNKAFDITLQTLAYTNHTILAEALEKWDIDLFSELLPEVYSIIKKIQARLEVEMTIKGLSKKEIEKLNIIDGKKIKMAFLAIYGTHSTNGVAELHTEILKATELNNWYKIYPERFNNKTNGITQRRWLLKSNPELSELITELLGTDGWITDLSLISGLKEYANDEEVLKRFIKIKNRKKEQLTDYIGFNDGVSLDMDSIFDIQIKRLHEYKRQLLNAFHVLDLYFRIKAKDPKVTCKRSFIFGAKSAPGYHRAKGIIKFINEIKNLFDNDAEARKYIKVVFVENYNVSYGEMLFPAADISEQISTAGKEASGTGNMKFMLNGACTIGTLDGANVEIVEEAGAENNFIFGLKVEDIEKIKDSYDPKIYYNTVPGLKKVVDTLIDGTFSDDGSGVFKDLHESLLEGHDWEKADTYFVLRDFDEYRKAHERVCDAYLDQMKFARMCFLNIAGAGKFSSDRTIEQYSEEIWNVEKLQ